MFGAKLTYLANVQQVCGGQALQLCGRAPRHPVLSAQPLFVTLQAHFDSASVQGPASKIVNRTSRQRRFNGKGPKVDWEQSIGKVRRRIRSAVMKSRSAKDEELVRAIACAFFDSKHGLQACATGYLMTPVSYSVVAWYIRQDTVLHSDNDFDNGCASEDDAMDEQDMPSGHAEPSRQYNGEGNDMPDISSLLEDREDCKRYFTVLRSPHNNLPTPEQSQPYLIADLHTLIQGYQLQKVQDLLPRVHQLSVHPEDPAYATELHRLTTLSKSKQ